MTLVCYNVYINMHSVTSLCVCVYGEQVRYRPNTPLVLKGITLSIHGREKIGIVGRTGSGKSTMIQVMFRLVEPAASKIVIDGINICTLRRDCKKQH